MRRRAGLVLIEMLVYAALSTLVISLVSVAFMRFSSVHRRTELLLQRLMTCSRLIEAAKLDLRRAQSVSETADGMVVTLADGRSVRYRFDAQEGTVETDDGRAWFSAFERVAFRADGVGVAISIDLKRELRDAHAPTIETWVAVRGRVR